MAIAYKSRSTRVRSVTRGQLLKSQIFNVVFYSFYDPMLDHMIMEMREILISLIHHYHMDSYFYLLVLCTHAAMAKHLIFQIACAV